MTLSWLASRREPTSEDAVLQAKPDVDYQRLVDCATEGLFRTTPDGSYLLVNSSLARMLRFASTEEMLRATQEETLLPLYLNPLYDEQLLETIKKEGAVHNRRVQLQRKDASLIWVVVDARGVMNAADELVYVEGAMRDVTDEWWVNKISSIQSRMAQILVEEVSRDVCAKVVDAFCEHLRGELAVLWNCSARSVQYAKLIHSSHANTEAFEKSITEIALNVEGGLVGNIYHSDSIVWVSNLKALEADPHCSAAYAFGARSALGLQIKASGEMLHIVELFLPEAPPPPESAIQMMSLISDQLGLLIVRSRQETAFRESETLKNAIMRSSLDSVVVFDEEGVILEFNRMAEKILDFSAQTMGANFLEAVFPELLANRKRLGLAFYTNVNEQLADEEVIERPARLANGREFTAEVSVARVMSAGAATFVATVRDASDRKRAEKAGSDLKTVLENSSGALIVKSSEDIITAWSPGAEALYGYSEKEIIGQPASVLIPDDALETYMAMTTRVRSREAVANVEMKRMQKDGGVIWVSASGKPLCNERGSLTGISEISHDISMHKRLEQQFMQSQKMEAIGRQAVGVAHDFNNVLTAILGFSDLLLREINEQHAMYHGIDEIRKAATTAAAFTHQLLAFSRKRALQFQEVHLNEVLNRLEKMLLRLLGNKTQLKIQKDSKLDWVKADTGQIEQVILNLVINARDAMGEGGKVTIQTKNVRVDRSRALKEKIPCGDYVKIAISDTGNGIPEEVRPHIFDAFYTTKEDGKGTGLGLATCQGIVSQGGGYIVVDSEIGKGTVFSVYLPRAEKYEDTLALPENDSEMPHGDETILIVEDEMAVRQFCAHILKQLGYRVLEAENSTQARALAGATPELKMALLDMMLPDTDGSLVGAALKQTHPTVRVVFTSGYADDPLINGMGEVEFLEKPYTAIQLARKVRKVLDQGSEEKEPKKKSDPLTANSTSGELIEKSSLTTRSRN